MEPIYSIDQGILMLSNMLIVVLKDRLELSEFDLVDSLNQVLLILSVVKEGA